MKNPSDLSIVGQYGSFKLFRYEDVYYASNVDYSNDQLREMVAENKLISADTEDLLVDIIESGNKWADTRGMYGLEKDQRKSPIRANSFNLEVNDEADFTEPELFYSDGEYYIIEGSDKDTIKDKQLFVLANFSVSAAPELISDYKGYNIIEFDKTYFGVKQALGSIDLTTVSPVEVDGIVYGDMVKTVMDLIDEYTKNAPLYPEPHQIEEFESHNIVGYKDKIFGIPHSKGAIDLVEIEENGDPDIFTTSSVEEMRAFISEKSLKATFYEAPHQIEEFESHNIVGYKDKIFGIPHSKGAIDLVEIKENGDPDIFTTSSVEEMRAFISEKSLKATFYEAPHQIEEFESHNIVGYKDKIFGIPHSKGAIDLVEIKENGDPDIFTTSSVEEMRAFISEKSLKAPVYEQGNASKQELIEIFDEFQIFEFEGIYFAVPREMVGYDLSMEDYFKEPRIIYDSSIFGLREALRAR